MNSAFFDAVRAALFGGSLSQAQVDGMNAIGAAWDKWGDGDNRKLAYLLGTAKHETAHTMQPIHERGGKAYFNKYEPGTKIGKALGNTLPGDGYKFRGRGDVQLTGRANYVKAGKAIGVDLVANPDAALEQGNAARILVVGCMQGWFTGKKLGDYFTDATADWTGARRVVNGTDRAQEIGQIAMSFYAALRSVDTPRPAPTRPPIQPDPKPAPPVSAPDPQPNPPVINKWVVASFLGAICVIAAFLVRF